MNEWTDRLLFQGKREELIEKLRTEKGISEPTLQAMSEIPRHLFISPRLFNRAYLDTVLPIFSKPNWRRPLNVWRSRSTLSQPATIGIMTDRLELEPTDKVLEIGTGTGYQAAILSKLAAEVITVDVFHDLCQAAKERLERLRIDNVNVLVADGSIHFTEEDVFDKIIVTASVPPMPSPHPLLNLLKPGGLAVMPLGGVGGENSCQMLKIRALDDGFVIEEQEEKIYGFVSMQGQLGWRTFTRIFMSFYHERAIKQLDNSSNE